MSGQNLSLEQLEIVDLLKNEIAELVDIEKACFELANFDEGRGRLYDQYMHLEQIGNALELAGLGGLSFCSIRILQNFKTLIEDTNPINAIALEPILNWGQYFIDYLEDISKNNNTQIHVNHLLDFLSKPTLPLPLSEDEIHQAIEYFNNSDLSTIDNSEPTLPKTVTNDMVSLEILYDVKPDLLQSMLIELPEQIKQFESSVSDFLSSAEFTDLQQAQRIAHTIKGAANVVSVRGLANLTHFTEDLLETAAKNLNQAPTGFDDLLVRTSDCLAATAEYLNHLGPVPEDLPEIMQMLLDWLNKLKHNEETVGEANIDLPATPTDNDEALQQTSPESDKAHQKIVETAESERRINLPESTAQELLRLSGEMQISNNQLSSQITAVEASLNLTDRYHKQIKTMASELEALVQTQSALKAASMKYSDNEIDPLEMERFNELHTFSHRLLELTMDSYETVSSIDQQVKELSALTHSHKQLNDDNQTLLLEMNLLPIDTLSSRFSRCVRQTCRLTNKAAKLEIIGEKMLLDSRVLNRIADPIMHLLRNAIDHGFENSSEERTRVGKTAEGKITLSFIGSGDAIKIVCEDDGHGLNYDKIRAIAIKRGLLDKDTEPNQILLNQFVLMPGFSTRDTATHTSGRGIGLDSVVSEIRSLKGTINISSEPGNGCQITMVVPTSILTSHALLVSCRDRHTLHTYGVATRGVKQVLYVDQDELIHHNGRISYEYNGDQIPVHTLTELLGLLSLEDEHIAALLIIQKSDSSLLAIGAERISASQDLIIKPLNRFSYQAPGVIGATILGNGSVSPVIDLQELPGMFMSQKEINLLQEQRARLINSEKASLVSPPAALIVDDSLSARRSLAQFITDMGMEVYTAKDGFDAIHVLEEKKPTLMLVDLEMPRMNGLELTAHIRSQTAYQDMPVIMITSRSTSRHMEMARNVGVTTYLTKPWSDDELLNCISKQIA